MQRQGRDGQETVQPGAGSWLCLTEYTSQCLWAFYRTKNPDKWKTLVFFIPEEKKSQFDIPERLIRTPWSQIKGMQALPSSLRYQQPCPEPLLETPHHILPGWDTQLSGQEPTVCPFDWQSNKALLCYFTQHSLSEVHFGSSAQRPSFWHQQKLSWKRAQAWQWRQKHLSQS